MGALLSLPLLALPSMGTVRHPTLCESPQTDITSFLRLEPAVVVQLRVLLCAAHVVNVAIGQ